jgi:putative ABC transport system substrate-binding protein
MREGWEGAPETVLRDAAAKIGISLTVMLPTEGTPSEIERVFAVLVEQKPDALLVSGEGDLYANRKLIVELAERYRLPAMCPYSDYAEAGGLMAYTVDLAELLRHMAGEVHQVLTGTRPGDIPIYQPNKFELMINLKTAKKLGLAIPNSLVGRADVVIE